MLSYSHRWDSAVDGARHGSGTEATAQEMQNIRWCLVAPCFASMASVYRQKRVRPNFK